MLPTVLSCTSRTRKVMTVGTFFRSGSMMTQGRPIFVGTRVPDGFSNLVLTVRIALMSLKFIGKHVIIIRCSSFPI